MVMLTLAVAEKEAGCKVVARQRRSGRPPEAWCVTHNCDASPCYAAEAVFVKLEAFYASIDEEVTYPE